MTDDEIRTLVRVAIQRHLGESAFAREMPGELRRDAAFGRGGEPVVSLSFNRYPLPRAEDDTTCLIEPAVRCNHCGYCQCHGH